jgi:hypothetical protein
MIDIKEAHFDARNYACFRTVTTTKEVMNNQTFWQNAFKSAGEYAGKNGLTIVGPAAAIYYKWDMEADVAELAIGFPVKEDSAANEVANHEIIKIPAGDALLGTAIGDYANLPGWHMEVKKSLREMGKTESLTVEEYAVMPGEDGDMSKCVTNLWYLY